ncbi:TVP38/TMEM64 family protein [Legionella spiritensis]|uniref:TVP38/TMEM64 family protein n=1 Tax=Legionella spiritensis TaxID=452 RepID=UPI000F6D7A94|nr:TVP38/TMEM64 family protein [Legionella spiritensis]VEG91714.1 mercuric reductase [Legionella spiritensis]
MDNISTSSKINAFIRRFIPLILLLLLLVLFFSFGLQNYLSFKSLQQHHQALEQWTNDHYVQVALLFCLVYVVAVAVSIPGAVFLTLAGGFLFGPLGGTVYVVLSATLGATLLYLAVRLALADWMTKKTAGRLAAMRDGFQQDAFHYLLVLRLIPVFPFWLVNIVPALLNVPARLFITATLIGIIPGTFVYVSIGNGLNAIFASGQTPNLTIIFKPVILLPLLGLALLSLLPIAYKRWVKKNKPQNNHCANDDSFD